MQIEAGYRKPANYDPRPGRLVLLEAAGEMCLGIEFKLGRDYAVLYLSGSHSGVTEYHPGTGFLEYVGDAKLRVSEAPSAWGRARPDVPVALWTDGLQWKLSSNLPHGQVLNVDVETGEASGALYRGWYIHNWSIGDDANNQLLP